jgi:hypothetical protein
MICLGEMDVLERNLCQLEENKEEADNEFLSPYREL